MSKERVLFVTPRAYLLGIVRYNLAKRGYRVVGAATAEETAAAALAEKPQLLLVDRDLPFADGLALARTLAEKITPRPKVLVVAPAPPPPRALEEAGLGEENVLLEPFALEDLFERVDRVLGDEKGVSLFTQAGWIVLGLQGTVDHHFSGRLRQALATLLSTGHARIVVDFTEVEFFAHQNLVPLLSAQARLEKEGGEIRLVGLSENLRKMFEKAGILEVFPLFEGRAEALRT